MRALETRRLFIFGGASHTGAMSGVTARGQIEESPPGGAAREPALHGLRRLRSGVLSPLVGATPRRVAPV